MARERTDDLSPEVTTRILAERLTNQQLSELVGNKKFDRLQPFLIEELLLVNDIGMGAFKKVHSFRECKIEEMETGEGVRCGTYHIDVGDIGVKIPLKKLLCAHHKTTSVDFFRDGGNIREGPFANRYKFEYEKNTPRKEAP